MLKKGPLILLIVLLGIFGPLSTDMYLPGLPEMVEYFETTESIMGMTLYMFMLALAVGVLVLGPLSDKYGRRKILIASMVLYTASSIVCSIAPNIWILIGLRVVQAVGGAGAMCISIALVKDCFEGREMGRILSLTSALAVIGPIIAPILGNVLIETLDWQSTFWVPAIVSLLCLGMAFGIPSSIPVNRSTGSLGESLKGVVAVVKDRNFSAFTIMMTVFMCAQLAYVSVSTYVFQGTFGMTSTEYSLALAGTLVCGIALMVVLQKVVSGRKTLMTLSLLLGLGMISLVAMVLLGHVHWAMFMVTFVPCSGGAMLARAYGFNILMTQSDDNGGAVSSVINFASFVFCCLGVVVASMPWESYINGITFTILISCILYAVMWVVVIRGGYSLKGLEDARRTS